MPFDSFLYIAAFLPAVVLVQRALVRLRLPRAAAAWLVLAGLAFLAARSWPHAALLCVLVLANHPLGLRLGRSASPGAALAAGVLGNLAAAYAAHAWGGRGWLAPEPLAPARSLLAPAVALFVLQQVAWLAERARRRCPEVPFLDFALFSAFFPQLLAGPVARPGELLPQLRAAVSERPPWRALAEGLALFALGLAKQTWVADSLVVWANAGWSAPGPLSLEEAWLASVANMLHLFFDLSSVLDMALGSALLLGVRLPPSFERPFAAADPAAFWRRFHTTLHRWLRDYVYLPLGGGKAGAARAAAHGAAAFLAGGLVFGAGPTVLLWAGLNAAAWAAHRLWRAAGLRLAAWLAWPALFLYLNAGSVLFRSETLEAAGKVLRGMAGLNGRTFLLRLDIHPSYIPTVAAPVLLALLVLAVRGREADAVAAGLKPDKKAGGWAALALLAGLLGIGAIRSYLYLGT